MSGRATDPRRLDVMALAAADAALDGSWPLSSLNRLPQAQDQTGAAIWALQASLRRAAGGAAEPWLALNVSARVQLACQRCLQDFELPLRIEANFRFVADETLAAALDADAEEDVLPLPQRLDLHELVEDELLLALPLVPMHETCPQPLVAADRLAGTPGSTAAEPAPAHPFAALQALKRH